MSVAPTPASSPDAGQAFLAALTDPEQRAIPFRTAVVVAHPDDETLACGSLLPRLSGLTIIHVTDGAPGNGEDAARHGFDSPQAYAAARRAELERAVALAGIRPEQLAELGWPDQGASAHIAEIARDLAGRLANIDAVITHAYEGGHPDHDATAMAVSAAATLLGESAPAILEAPLYRAGPDGWAVQSFARDSRGPEVVLELTPDEQRLKQAMLNSFETQREVVMRFSAATERFRPAPDYDFGALPNGGQLLYEIQRWGMCGSRWLELARAARAQLGLERAG